MSKNRLHSVIQRFNLKPPEGKILADKNMSWWDEQEFSELTAFQVKMDLDIVKELDKSSNGKGMSTTLYFVIEWLSIRHPIYIFCWIRQKSKR